MQINKHHGNYNLSKRTGNPVYIVVHYTAGTGSAKNNCIYFSGGNRNASADYFIDDEGVWEYNDPGSGYYTWAVGDGGGRYGITNSNSCHIEVVNTGGAFSEKQIGYLTGLVQHLMARFGIPANRVVRHYDASRKTCPLYYVDSERWNALHSRITSGAVELANEWLFSDFYGKWWYRHADGSCTKGGWEFINGKWYLFDAEGWMLTGWQVKDGVWYLLSQQGYMLTGWQWTTENDCYFLSDNGALYFGWKEYHGKWYFLDPQQEGRMATNKWIYYRNHYYWVDGYGVMAENEWKWIDNNWYYFGADGVMATNCWIGNYWVESDGRMKR